MAQKEKLTELQLRVRQLLDQVEQITKEQNYQRVLIPLIICFLRFGTSVVLIFILKNRFYIPISSIERNGSGKRVKVLTREYFGGR